MKFIGITGGVGAGKSELLHYIKTQYSAKVILADVIARDLMKPGNECYKKIREAFAGLDVFTNDGSLDSYKMADLIFSETDRREKMNNVVHPAVKKEILRQVEEEKSRGEYAYFILEAALLIEDGYGEICDELWYICTSEEIRRERLKQNRGYSDAKIDAIFFCQLPEEAYRKSCVTVIENNGTLEEAYRQIDRAFDQIKTVV